MGNDKQVNKGGQNYIETGDRKIEEGLEQLGEKDSDEIRTNTVRKIVRNGVTWT